MNPLLVKFRNDRIFREGTFPEMRSEYVADCSRPEALARILPGDSFETLLATQDDTACFRSPPRGGRGGRNSRRERRERRVKTSRGVRGVRGGCKVDSTVRDFD